MTLSPDLIRQAGMALFGNDWRGAMAGLLGVNARRIGRIDKAARDGTPFDVPPAWATEIKAALDGLPEWRKAQGAMATAVIDALGEVEPAEFELSEAERLRAAL